MNKSMQTFLSKIFTQDAKEATLKIPFARLTITKVIRIEKYYLLLA